MLHPDDTIAAIASAPGGSARGIIRLSGPQAIACLQSWFVADDGEDFWPSRTARVVPGKLRLQGIAALAHCDAYLWPTTASYTRQPMAELHMLGSPPLLAAVLQQACRHGARLAQPGEFTLRAFLAGRLDLTQAEAVLGVIDAADRRELDAALMQLAGGVGGALRALRDRLLDLLAHLEAGLDFVDEDIEFIRRDELERGLRTALADALVLLDRMQARGEATEYPRVVIFGWPNVGKSSLFNALVGDNQAIVSAQPGATRDYLSARLEFAGMACELIDTAGVQIGAETTLARQAQEAAREQRQRAQLTLLCLDSSRPLNAWERRLLTAGEESAAAIVVLTKSDAERRLQLPSSLLCGQPVSVSSATGEGLQSLRERICEGLFTSGLAEPGIVASTAVRSRESLLQTIDGLQRAIDLVETGRGDELVAAELRISLDRLGAILGVIYTDDVLDRIFSRFCIGK